MDMRRLQQMMGMGGGGGAAAEVDAPKSDTAEKVQISSLSLLKMLKHGNFTCSIQVWFRSMLF